MSSFRDDIKVPTKEEKDKLICKILTTYKNMGVMGMGMQLNKNKIVKDINAQYKNSLSTDEIMAVACISRELIDYCIRNKSYIRNADKKKFIESIYNHHEINEQNVTKTVKATIDDVVGFREFISEDGEYEFNVRRVLDILDGKDPYRIHREAAEAKIARSKFKIIE